MLSLLCVSCVPSLFSIFIVYFVFILAFAFDWHLIFIIVLALLCCVFVYCFYSCSLFFIWILIISSCPLFMIFCSCHSLLVWICCSMLINVVVNIFFVIDAVFLCCTLLLIRFVLVCCS